MSNLSLQNVQETISDGRSVPFTPRRPLRQDHRLAFAVARALRSDMQPAGIAPPMQTGHDDEALQAEAEYRALTKQERPVFGTAKFRIHDSFYMFDAARPIIREALELHLKRSKRSNEAVWLELALHNDTLDDYAVFRAKAKLLWIYERLKPL